MDVPVNRIEYLAEHLFSLVLLAEIKSYERISGTGGEIQKFCNMSVAVLLYTRVLPLGVVLYTRALPLGVVLYTRVLPLGVVLSTRVVSVRPLPSFRSSFILLSRIQITLFCTSIVAFVFFGIWNKSAASFILGASW
jgi:hypothetical protein